MTKQQTQLSACFHHKLCWLQRRPSTLSNLRGRPNIQRSAASSNAPLHAFTAVRVMMPSPHDAEHKRVPLFIHTKGGLKQLVAETASSVAAAGSQDKDPVQEMEQERKNVSCISSFFVSSRFVCDKFLGHNVSAFLCLCRACCHLLLLQLAALILLTCLLLGATRALCCHCRLSILTRTSDFVLDLASSISITPRFPCACRTP